MNMLHILEETYRNVVYIYALCKISFNLNQFPSLLNFRSVFSIRYLQGDLILNRGNNS